MTSISRFLQRPWATPWATPPPSSCSTLILASSTINYGATCAFPEEDAPTSAIPFDTACLPWLASATAASNAFYSPATACPPSWKAIATQTSGLAQAVAGETALSCCPNGFEDGGRGMCKPASTGTFAVVECGEADAEENESRTYAGASWPARATVSVPALQLRFRAEDTRDASSTTTETASGTPSGTSSSGGKSGGGLSTGAKAAIGVVVPLVFILLALAIFLLWQRRRRNKAVDQHDEALAETKAYSDTSAGVAGSTTGTSPHPGVVGSTAATSPHPSVVGSTVGTSQHPHAVGSTVEPSQQPHVVGSTVGTSQYPHVTGSAVATSQHPHAVETPEWNMELEATETQRQRAAAPTASAAQPSVSELGGLMRKPRKPVPAVEMEGSPAPAEMDVSRYMAYQPPRDMT